MPQDGPPYLSDDEIALIVDWINEGANEMPTSNEQFTQLPDGYELKGNYPNPFNPSTTVSFEVPEAVNYTLKVYNIQGVLVKEYTGKHSAGSINLSVNFNADPSAIYFYKVLATADGNRYLIGTGKMTLIK